MVMAFPLSGTRSLILGIPGIKGYRCINNFILKSEYFLFHRSPLLNSLYLEILKID
jgi:hypothetical protein